MTKPTIRSLADLQLEKERLKASLKRSKSDLKDSFDAVKEEFNPLGKVIKTTRNIFTSDSEFPLLGLGVEQLTNLVIKKGLLRNAGWLPRLVAPFLIKKISTYLIALKGSENITGSLHHLADKLRDHNSRENNAAYPKNKNRKKEPAAPAKKNIGNKPSIS